MQQGSHHNQSDRTPRRGPWRAVVLVLAAGLLLSLTAVAQSPRIGYVDWKRLLDSAPQVRAVKESLDQEFRPRNESLMADEARLERMQEELAEAGEADDETRFEMEREIRNLRSSIERRREDLSEELRFRTNAEMNELEETLELAVQRIAREGDYDLILNSPVAYASESIDITDQVLEWLEEDFNSDDPNITP